VIGVTKTELFASRNLGHARKDKGGQHARFAELTQQLYLGLLDPWEQLRQPSPVAAPAFWAGP